MIDAVVAVETGGDNVRMVRRVQALQEFVDTGDGADLLVAYKRAANILKKENWTGPQVMSSAEEQGIPQTGEEDPLVLVEEPGVEGGGRRDGVGTGGRGPAAGEGADRCARRCRAEGVGAARRRGFHRRDGRARLAAEADRRILRPCDGQRPRRRPSASGG